MKVITKIPAPIWGTVELLDDKIKKEIYRIADELPLFEERLCEIRLRVNCAVSLTLERENIILNISISKDEMEECVKRLCDGSVYAYSDTINHGYITLKNGCRVGIVGTAVTEENRICSVRDITSLNIRIARNIRGIGRPILDIIRKTNYRCGVLIYSSPGVGKTTLLRSVAYELSKTKRVALVDSRAEMYDWGDGACLADVLVGYPKGKGIEIATRTLSPEYIVCDEIGAEEIGEMISSHAMGVPLIASIHADSYRQLIKNDSVKRLVEIGIFDVCVGIERKETKRDFIYDINYFGEDLC